MIMYILHNFKQEPFLTQILRIRYLYNLEWTTRASIVFKAYKPVMIVSC